MLYSAAVGLGEEAAVPAGFGELLSYPQLLIFLWIDALAYCLGFSALVGCIHSAGWGEGESTASEKHSNHRIIYQL